MLQRSRQHFVLPVLLFASIALVLCGSATADKSAKKTPANESSVTTPTKSPGSETLLKEIFEPGQIRDTVAFMTAALRGFPVTANALGDMNEDGVMNIRDLIRIRNIRLGIGDPASAYELTEGDFDLDLVIDQQDVLAFREALMNMIGLPHLIDSLGGEVRGLGITATYGPGDADSSTYIRIDDWTAAEIEAYSGVEFSALATDSTYFMKGFKFESNSENTIYPPQMKIALDAMPPCSLAGSNNLMAARRGPSGNTEMIFLTELDSIDAATLLSPPPPYPVCGEPVKVTKEGRMPKTSYEPFELMEIPLTNFSHSLIGNIVSFKRPNSEWWSMTPIAFAPDTARGFSEVTGIVVPVAPIEPGITRVRVRHLGTGLVSNEFQIEILPLHTPSYDIDSMLTNTFDLLDSALALFPACSLFTRYPYTLLTQEINDFVSLRAYLPQILTSLVNADADFRQYIAAIWENMQLPEYLYSVIYGSTKETPPDTISKRVSDAIGELQCPTGCKGACLPVDIEDWPESSSKTASDLCQIFNEDPPNTIKDRNGRNGASSRWFGDLHGSSPEEVGEYAEKYDPSCLPRAYPGFCINIWKHNTNAQGGMVGGAAPPPNGDDPEFTCPPIMKGDQSFARLDPSKGLPSAPLMKDAIVTPLNGGIPGIVGVVNAVGAFAIPGLHPGDSINFAVYDPHSGLVDPDAGYGISPDTAEQGLWFPVYLYFNPDTTVYHIPIANGDHPEDTISASRPIIEYLLSVSPDQIGDTVNYGFSSDGYLTFRLQRPSGQYMVSDSSTMSKMGYGVILDELGVYKFTVTFGAAAGDGAFEIGVSQPPEFPIQRISGPVKGRLTSRLSPYMLVNSISAGGGDSLISDAGSHVSVSRSVTISNSGYIHLPTVTMQSGGILTHPRGFVSGVKFTADTLVIQSGGKIDVNAKGYRGTGRDGWGQLYGETAPGQTASTGYCGGSHGGFAGTQKTTGAPGSVYGIVDNPTTLGAGGADNSTTTWGAGNGGGVINIVADALVFSGGELRANGAAGLGYSFGGGGAGGSINITAGHISGNAIISAYGGNGGTYGSSSESTGGGGGRIAIHYSAGTISGLTLGTTAGSGYYSNGGAGTIYLQGPDGEDGILLIKNGGVAGATTPLPAGHGQFKRVDVLWGGRLTVGPLTDSLLALDSMVVSNTNSYITCADYTTCITPLLRVKDSGYVRVDTNVTLQLPVIRLNNGGDFRTATDIAFASASDFSMNSTASYVFVGKNTSFTIPQFNTTNMIAGYFYNAGDLLVGSDSIIIGANVNLVEDGRIGPGDSVGYLRVIGKVDQRSRIYSIAEDDLLDTGLVFKAGTLIIESGGSIDVSSRGYRGNGRDSWSSGRSETHPGYLGASYYAGGSHGGLGGTDDAGYPGDPGNVFDSQTNPRYFGAGGGGDSPNNPGGNGGGAVVINVGSLIMNGGLIRSQGQAGTSYGGGGAGGSINIHAQSVSGTGTISANGGAGGTYGSSGPSGGGGGGRIAFYWTTGSISGLTFTVTGGTGQNGTDGALGTVYTQQITKNSGEGR